MKKIFLITCSLIFSLVTVSAQENAKVVVIRDSDFRNAIINFPVFVNEYYAEKIQFGATSTLVVPAGNAILSFRYYGRKKPWKYAEKLPLNLQSGETKYVMVTQIQRFFRTVIIPLEVTEATAERFPQRLNFTVEVAHNK